MLRERLRSRLLGLELVTALKSKHQLCPFVLRQASVFVVLETDLKIWCSTLDLLFGFIMLGKEMTAWEGRTSFSLLS